MLSSKGDAKTEARFAARLDVLMERVDTLAATVATTASAMAHKDGEIATLRRDLEARDETLAALVARTQSGSPAGDQAGLKRLEEAVASLAAERSKHGNTKQLEDITAKVGLLGQRMETLSAAVSTTAAGLAGRDGELAAIRKRLDSAGPSATAAASTDPAVRSQLDELTSKAAGTTEQLDTQAAELAALKERLERRDTDQHAPAEELRAMLTTLRTRVESLDGLRAGVTEEDLDERLTETNDALASFAKRIDALAESVEAATGLGDEEHELDERLTETNDALASLAKRIDALAESVEAATTGLGDKEHELAALHRHFVESSGRVETIVGDLREALGAFPDAGPDTLAALDSRIGAAAAGLASVTSRLEQLESARTDDRAGDLVERIDALDGRVAALADEISRAKTLWPVALRSLEARLDDVARRPADLSVSPATPDATGTVPEDLLAGLRDSLHAMESVAAELERTSEAHTDDDAASVEEPDPGSETLEPEDVQEAVAGGARVVPLRQSDP
jgi:DNA repair exonuclease SbcCD ATPase subunit